MKIFLFLLFVFVCQTYAQLNMWKKLSSDYFYHIANDSYGNIFLNKHDWDYSIDSVLKSSDRGNTWNAFFVSNPSTSTSTICVDTVYLRNDRIIIDYSYELDYITTDKGLSWQIININGLSDYCFSNNGYIFACETGYYSQDYLIFKSSNNGVSWDTISTLPIPAMDDHKIMGLEIDRSENFYLSVLYNSSNWPFEVFSDVFKSSDNGLSWELFFRSSFDYSDAVQLFSTYSGDIFIMDPGIMRTSHFHSNGGTSVYEFALHSVWQKNTNEIYLNEYISPNDAFLYSYDSGMNWENISSGLSNENFSNSYLCNDNLGFLYFSSPYGLYKSNFTTERIFSKPNIDFDNVRINDTTSVAIYLQNPSNFSIEIDSIISYNNQFYITELADSSILPNDSISVSISFIPNKLDTTKSLICLYSEKINARLYVTGVSPYPVIASIPSSVLLFNSVIVDSSITKSIKIFNPSYYNNLILDSLYLFNNSSFSINIDSLPIVLEPNDTIEIPITFSPNRQQTYSDTLFISNNSKLGIKKIRLYGNSIVSVSNIIVDNPIFSLSQNYPNPFNPNTIISWQSPLGGWQTLKVYDVLGNEVATLVDEEKPTGSYEVEFNASELASGIYYYQLKVGEYVGIKKMVFLK